MGKFKITGGEWAFVGIMTLLAVIFTNEYWLRLLAKFNPLIGFLIYYVIVYGALTLMSYLGLVVFGVKIKKPLQIIGSGLVLFAFFVIFNWSSDYANLVNAPQVLWNNSEDGLTWFLSSLIFHPTTATLKWVAWAFAFPITVFILTILGVFLVHRKPKLNA